MLLTQVTITPTILCPRDCGSGSKPDAGRVCAENVGLAACAENDGDSVGVPHFGQKTELSDIAVPHFEQNFCASVVIGA